MLDIGTTWSSREIARSKELLGTHSTPGITALVDSLWGPTPIRDPKARQAALEEYFELARWPNLIQLIGGLAVEDAITPRAIYSLWGGGILSAWDGWEQPIRQLRNYQNEYEAYVNFEWIANQMKAIHRERSAADPD